MKIDEKMTLLQNLGLSNPEIVAYTSLLKIGETGASELAKEMNIKRTSVYPILENLIEKGVVNSYKRGSKTFFVSLSPSKLLSWYEHKLESLTSIIPVLEKLQGTQAKAYGVRFLQTKRELRSFYNEILDDYKDKTYYIIGNANTFINLDPDYILEFRRKRAALNIRTKLILSSDSKSAAGQDDPSLIRDFKYLPEKFKFDSTIDIFDDKILIIGPEVKSLGVVIAIPPMVDVFRSVFEVLWESLN